VRGLAARRRITDRTSSLARITVPMASIGAHTSLLRLSVCSIKTNREKQGVRVLEGSRSYRCRRSSHGNP
jgi:hypothetical protein